MEIPHYNNGTTGRTEVDPSFLGDKVLTKTLHKAVVMYLANKRVGTHDTKTRGEVARSKKAMFKQKGLGRARVRHPQVPQCRGGGVAHGPHPRDYRQAMPKKARRLALKSALLSKFRDGQVLMASALPMDRPRTKDLASVLRSLGAAGSCLIVSDAPDRNLVLSARNLPNVKVCSVKDLNAYDVLAHKHLLVTEDGFDSMKEAHGHA
jgi:large subunit ribosomal protein L4